MILIDLQYIYCKKCAKVITFEQKDHFVNTL